MLTHQNSLFYVTIIAYFDFIYHECCSVPSRNANMWTPLDCAASRGWTKCAEALLEGDSPIDPMDWGKVIFTLIE